MTEELTRPAPVPTSMTRRQVVAGAAALGAVTLAGTRLAQAQDSTATPGDDSTDTTEPTDLVDRMAERYQDFVSRLAANLGVTDSATVDTGIRDALKAMVDDLLAAGEISVNFAAERKAEIDESVAPLRPGGHRFGNRGNHGRGHGRGNSMLPADHDDATDSVVVSESTWMSEDSGPTIA